ncbi:MAG: hypothetical protein U0Z44_07665 [Kouleothrix sp.]
MIACCCGAAGLVLSLAERGRADWQGQVCARGQQARPPFEYHLDAMLPGR